MAHRSLDALYQILSQPKPDRHRLCGVAARRKAGRSHCDGAARRFSDLRTRMRRLAIHGGNEMRRLVLALTAAAVLTVTPISIPVAALGEVQVNLSCSDGI